MKLLIKFPMLALLLFTAVETVSPGQAVAGQEGVTQPDSSGVGVSDSFSPATDAEPGAINVPPAVVSAKISAAVVNIVQTIQTQLVVASVTGGTLSISPDQVATIVAAVSASGADIEPAITALEQQLAAELGGGGLDIDITMLGSSAGDLNTAIEAANSLILSLSSEQLAAAIESPTFMALLQILGGGNDATVDGEDVLIVEGDGAVGIPLLTSIFIQ